MIFSPYTDEIEIINTIHNYNENDYALIRLTPTMIEKNNIDANSILRDLLAKYHIADYGDMMLGGKNGIKKRVKFIFNSDIETGFMNFYRVNNNRGDRRFSIYGIKKLVAIKLININDLLYMTVANDTVVLMNLTHNVPKKDTLLSAFGISSVDIAVEELISKLRSIAQEGPHKNSYRTGKASPRDAGDTLEQLLDIKTNNRQNADFKGLVELKSKTGKTLDTLFTLRPNFSETPVSIIETNDRNRVSAFERLYGYYSEAHPNSKSLYVTIGPETKPQNNVGLYLLVNDENRTVELRKKLDEKKTELAAFWTFADLEKELHIKHKTTLWVDVETCIINNDAYFNYIGAHLSKSPQFLTFLSLIQSGDVTYDWRGYTSVSGPYSGKNHGNAWRIKNNKRKLLFGSLEKINLL